MYRRYPSADDALPPLARADSRIFSRAARSIDDENVLEYQVSIRISPQADHAGNNKELPPIKDKLTMLDPEGVKTSTRSRSKSPRRYAAFAAHNRFHYNCCDQNQGGTPSPEQVKAKSVENAQKRREARTAAATASTPNKSGSPISNGSSSSIKGENGGEHRELTPRQVTHYLLSHPKFLERHVQKYVDRQTIQRWAKERKMDKADGLSSSNTGDLSMLNGDSSATTLVPVSALSSSLPSPTDEEGERDRADALSQVATRVAEAVSVARGNSVTPRVYLVRGDQLETVGGEEGECATPKPIGQSATTLAAYVAKTGETARACGGKKDEKFPDGIGQTKDDAYYAFAFPLLDGNSCVSSVFEFHRTELAFSEDEASWMKTACREWANISLGGIADRSRLVRNRKMSEFLMGVVKSVFMEMVSMDTLIIKIMNFAQQLVDADRASLFLVDSKTNQLYARIFDVQGKQNKEASKIKKDVDKDSNSENEEETEADATREIRFPVGIGIAGYVAETGETMNVRHAYSDPRFNKAVDEQTGYSTNNILCMPICIRGQVIGIVQMVNKASGFFNKEDEEAFEIFAVYCGLALHHAKLYDKIRRSEQKHKVALEVLSYHNSCSALEVDSMPRNSVPESDPTLGQYSFYALNMDDSEKVRKALFMFIDLFGLERFEYDTLTRFFITVKKNYRQVAYHNWTHGFHVANSIYSILKNSPGVFKPLECLSMFIGAICHDLDHRGFNNKFMIDVGSPLAAIYSTSTMEHHHFNMTVTILQQENHNIFSRLNPEEYRQVLGNIKHCILATDLALFFPNKARLGNILREKAFSWDLPDHRLLVQSVSLTGADLSSSAKPWWVQERTSKVVYAEFHEQVLAYLIYIG